jgi:hypothetical protein
VIVDSGLSNGVEKFCIRRNLSLIGIAPESMIEYPKPNPEKFSEKTLSAGHTHFIILGDSKQKLKWGEESSFKLAFAERLATGRKGYPYKSKVVGVIFGNIPNCESEIALFVDKNLPLILIEDSGLSQTIKSIRKGEEVVSEDSSKKPLLNKISSYNNIIEIEDDSENLAAAVHLCLTISF